MKWKAVSHNTADTYNPPKASSSMFGIVYKSLGKVVSPDLSNNTEMLNLGKQRTLRASLEKPNHILGKYLQNYTH
jgi:hypothetical protein